MKLAALFWFYKEVDICVNRLRILRKHNPDIQVFGLYGGNPDQANEFQSRLSPYLNDFYAFTQDKSPHWKWYHGDQMIVDWYRQRGVSLSWDTIFVAQWDMLVFEKLNRLFSMLKKDELLLSGLRPVKEVDPWWYYVRPGSNERDEYQRFIAYIREKHGYDDEPLCCEFIVSCLPRSFLEKYQAIPEPELGFLEYKIPTYAQIFSTPLRRDHPHQPWWGDAPGADTVPLLARALNSETKNVPLRIIEAHRLWPLGRRIFHPVFDAYPEKWVDRLRQIGSEILHDEIKKRWWRWHHKRMVQKSTGIPPQP